MARVATCVCGSEFLPITARHRWCSELCRSRSRVRRSGTCQYCGVVFSHRQSRPQSYCSRSCAMRAKACPASPLKWLECQQCAGWFVSRRGAKYCCDDCRERYAFDHINDRVMGLYRLAITELRVKEAMHWRRTLTDYLAQRDGNRCSICSIVVDLTLTSGPRGNRRGPSIDHVIPVSQGGEDTLTNLRLTHWACNNKRGNRGGNEQLRLIA